ncbi:MAG: LPS-assembly protein LptD [Bdellovibrionales bacterium]|nr:LPS-assembly protein LptD [Bdellovibrionales bacterium]
MSISEKLRSLNRILGLGIFLFSSAWAAEEKKPIHFSAEKTKWNRKSDQVELVGKATVTQPGEIVTADRIFLDQKARTLDAVGHCVYTTSETIIYADELHLNMDTRTGLILGGRVANDRFALTGERIEKIGEFRYLTQKGAYTTCVDCPQSWLITGEEIDMEFESYAFMKNVTTRVRDAPFFWFPYLIVPMKRQRQTGILFPRLSFFNGAFTYQLPFYWATSRSTDMTISLGEFGGRGGRVEWEGRYVFSDTSRATARFFFTNDQTFLTNLALPENSNLLRARSRFGFDLEQYQEFFGVDQKLRLLETSDNRYVNFLGDLPGRSEAALGSTISLSKNADDFSFFLTAQRYRNLLSFDNSSDEAKARSAILFDTRTVQLMPSLALTTRDRFLLKSPIAGGLTVGMSRFARAAGAFDRVNVDSPATAVPETRPYMSGIDPIRQATRFFVTPKMYTNLRPWSVLSFTPSAEYRAFFYRFNDGVDPLSRGYLLLRADLSTQLERIFTNQDPNIPKTKHMVRPILSYAFIPSVREDPNHPFIRQMKTAREKSLTGFNFDNQDIVPFDTSLSTANYFIPLGNSLTYGVTTQLIDRRAPIESENPEYRRKFELRTGQTFNFRELREVEGSQRPFSRLFAQMLTQGDRWATSTDYYYYPYISLPRNTVSTSVSYLMTRPRTDQIYYFERSLSLGYSYNFSSVNFRTSNLNARFIYSLNDYVMPTGFISWDFISKRALDVGLALRYQSMAQCWTLDLGVRRTVCPVNAAQDLGFCVNPVIDFQLNFAGQPFTRANPFGVN